MGANLNEFVLQLVDTRTKRPIDDDTGKVIVMNPGLPTKPTLYSDIQGSSQANPVTISNGVIRFFTDPSVTSVDLSVMTALGVALFLEDVTPSMGRVDVDHEQRHNVLVAPFLSNAAGTVTDTGVDFPANCLISDAFVKVTTLDTGETLSVGFENAVESGDLDGLIAAVSMSATGYIENAPVATAGSNIDFLAATTYGALLASAITGTDVVTVNGAYARKKYRTDGTIKSLVYTPSSTTSDDSAGYIFVGYDRLI